MDINWYPGHMAKAKRLINESLKAVDIVIEVLDARIPVSSRNPDFEEMFAKKQKIIILNKKDLADSFITDKWVEYFKKHGIQTICVSSVDNSNKKKIVDFIKKSAASIVDKYKSKGMNKTVRCMVAGIPNSGKSTFINMLCGKGKLKSEDRPGVTKANQWIKVDKSLEIMDTPGVLWPKLDEQRIALNLSFVGSIKDNIIDIEELACKLLERLGHGYFDRIQERYDIWERENGVVMLEQLCKRRGFILKGNEYDYERGARILLDEFRGGVLGQISLEEPGETISIQE